MTENQEQKQEQLITLEIKHEFGGESQYYRIPGVTQKFVDDVAQLILDASGVGNSMTLLVENNRRVFWGGDVMKNSIFDMSVYAYVPE